MRVSKACFSSDTKIFTVYNSLEGLKKNDKNKK